MAILDSHTHRFGGTLGANPPIFSSLEKKFVLQHRFKTKENGTHHRRQEERVTVTDW